MSFGDFMAYPSTFVSQHFHMENLLKSDTLISVICEFIDKYENRLRLFSITQFLWAMKSSITCTIPSEIFSTEVQVKLENNIRNVHEKIIFTGGQVNLTDAEISKLINRKILNENPELEEGKCPAIFASPVYKADKGLEYDTVFPLKQISFEGHLFSAPNHPRKKLSELYKDFMTYPSTLVSQHFNTREKLKSDALFSTICSFIDTYESR